MLTPGGWGRHRGRDAPHAAVWAPVASASTAEPARERATGSRAWTLAIAAGVVGAVAGSALALRGVDTTSLIGALQLATAAAVGLGARLHRPAHPLPWWLLASGLALNGARRLVVATVGASAAADGLVAVLHPVSLLLYVAAVTAVLVLRARTRPAEQLLDAAIMTLAVGLMATEAMRSLVAAPVSPAASVPPALVVIGLGVALVVVALHMVRTELRSSQRERGRVVLGLLAGAVMLRLGRDVLVVTGFDGGGLVAGGLTPMALGLAAAGMLHPASPRLVQPPVDRTAPSNARQLAAFGSALLVLPLLALSLTLREAVGMWVPLTAAGVVALTGLVGIRLERLVRSLRTTTALRHDEARRDLPTGLPNTRGLFEALADRARHQGPGRVGLLVISLAGVGEAGSVYGLDASAGLLEQLADRLTADLPAEASVAVLSGGDLAVVVAIESDAQLDELGWRVRELASRAVTVGGVPLSCRASVGIAVCEPHESPDTVVRRADLASRWAERAGAEGVQRYDASMDASVAYEVAVRADIREAIRHDELRVWCQPQIDIASGRMVGVECLARWRHPTYGSVPPAGFVAAARDIGAAAELDARMVRRAAQQAAAWRAAGLAIPRVAVNVEPTSLSDPGFIPAVVAALRSAQLPPGTLEIELTEAVTAHDQAHARKAVWQLRALGVSLAIDDFGTGYSSLAALHHLPMDAIKLDRELVNVLVDDPVLVGATITLVQRLGLRLVAEGVETPTELAMLEEAGCQVAQGYLLAEPMPADELMAWHERRAASSRARV